MKIDEIHQSTSLIVAVVLHWKLSERCCSEILSRLLSETLPRLTSLLPFTFSALH